MRVVEKIRGLCKITFCAISFTAHPGFDYTYDEIPELGHEWKFWNEELKRFLDFLHW